MNKLGGFSPRQPASTTTITVKSDKIILVFGVGRCRRLLLLLQVLGARWKTPVLKLYSMFLWFEPAAAAAMEQD